MVHRIIAPLFVTQDRQVVMTALRWDAGAMALASPKLRAAPRRNELSGFRCPGGQRDWPPSIYIFEIMRVRDTEEEGYMYMFEYYIIYLDLKIYIYISYILDSFCSLGYILIL